MSDDISIDLDDFDENEELNFDGDFDISLDSPQDDRNPVTKLGGTVLETAKENFTDTAKIAGIMRENVPTGYKAAWNTADNVIGETKKMADEALAEVRPALRELKKNTKRLLPAVKGFVPESWHSKAEAFLSDEEDSKASQEQIKMDADNSAIAASLNNIFAKQAVQQQQESLEETAKEQLRQNVEDKRANKNLLQTNDIINQLMQINAYNNDVQSKVSRQALELQFRQYFAQRDLLTLMQRYTVDAVNSLESIVKNTALPDLVKMRQSENVEQMLYDSIYGERIEKLRASAAPLIEKIKRRIGEKGQELKTAFKEGVGQSAEMAGQIADMQESTAEMGIKLDPIEFGGQLVADNLLNRLMGSIGKKVGKYMDENERLSLIGNNLRLALADGSGTLERIANGDYEDAVIAGKQIPRPLFELIQKAAGGLSSAGDNLDSINVVNTSKDQSLAAVAFDQLTRKSIVEIIPEFLSRIHAAVSGNPDRLVYNSDRGRLTRLSDAIKDASDNLFSKEDARNRVKKTREFVDELDLDENLGTMDRRKLMEVVADLSLTGKDFHIPTFMRMLENSGMNEDGIKKLREQLRVDQDGKLEAASGARARAAKLAEQFAEIRGTEISDRNDKIVDYNKSGGLGVLFEAGILKEDGSSLVFNRERADRVRKEALLDMANIDLSKLKSKPKADKTGLINENKASSYSSPYSNEYHQWPQGTPQQEIKSSMLNKLADVMTGSLNDIYDAKVLTVRMEDDRNGEGPDPERFDPILQAVDKLGNVNRKGFMSVVEAIATANFDEKTKGNFIRRMGSHLYKGSSSVFSAVGTGIGLGGRAIALPFKLMSSLYGGIKRGLGFGNKDDDEKGFLSKALDLAKSVGKGIYDKTVGRVIGGSARLIKRISSAVSGKARSLANRHLRTDIYTADDLETPKLFLTDLLNGRYISAKTGEVLKSFADIDGAVKDLDGNFVLNKEQLDRLVDRNGKRLKIRSLMGMAWRTATFVPRKLVGLGGGIIKALNNLSLKAYQTDVRAFVPDGKGGKVLEIVLYLTNLNKGHYFLQTPDGGVGKQLKNFAMISGPVVDGSGNVLVTEDMISDGLYDNDGKRIMTAGSLKRSFGLLSKAAKAPFAVLGKLKNFAADTLSSIKNYLFGDKDTEEEKAGIFSKLAGLFTGKKRVRVINVTSDVVNIYTKGGLRGIIGNSAPDTVGSSDTDSNTVSNRDGVSKLTEYGDAAARKTMVAGSKAKREAKKRLKAIRKRAKEKGQLGLEAFEAARDEITRLSKIELMDRFGTDDPNQAFEIVKTRIQDRLSSTNDVLADKLKNFSLDEVMSTASSAVDDLKSKANGKAEGLKKQALEGINKKRGTDGIFGKLVDKLDKAASSLSDIKDNLGGKKKDAKISGDADGDGDRDGSYKDQLSQKLQSLKESRLNIFRKSQTEQDGERNSLLDKLVSLMKKNNKYAKETAHNTDEGFGTKLMNGLKWLAGVIGMGAGAEGISDAIDMGGDVEGDRMGSKKTKQPKPKKVGLLKRLAGGAARFGGAALRVASVGVIGAAKWVGGALLGLLSGTAAVVAASAVAVAAVGVGAYYGYKYYKRRSDVSALEHYRFVSYGLNPNNEKHLVAIRYLEDELEDELTVQGLSMNMAEVVEDYAEDFGVDTDNEEQVAAFANWFMNRFLPIATSWTVACKNLKVDITDAHEDLSEKQQYELARGVFYSGKEAVDPYSHTTSPFPLDLPLLDREAVKEARDALRPEDYVDVPPVSTVTETAETGTRVSSEKTKERITESAVAASGAYNSKAQIAARKQLVNAQREKAKRALLEGQSLDYAVKTHLSSGLTKTEQESIQAELTLYKQQLEDFGYVYGREGEIVDVGSSKSVDRAAERSALRQRQQMNEEIELRQKTVASDNKLEREHSYRIETLNIARKHLSVSTNMDNTLVAIYEHICNNSSDTVTKVDRTVKRADGKKTEAPKAIKPSSVSVVSGNTKPTQLINMGTTNFSSKGG